MGESVWRGTKWLLWRLNFPISNLAVDSIFKGRISTKQIGYRSITHYSLAEIRLENAAAGNIPILENIADDYTKMKHEFLVAKITGNIFLDPNFMTRKVFIIDICMRKRIRDTELWISENHCRQQGCLIVSKIGWRFILISIWW